MSKPVKELLRKELAKRLEGVTSLAVVGFTGLDAVTTRMIRGRLRSKDIKLTVVKNSVARQAFKSVGLAQATEIIDGPCAVAYGPDSEQIDLVEVIRELLDVAKEAPNLTVKAALLEGEVFGPDRIEQLRKFPTRDEAISRLVSYALAPAGGLAGALKAPAGLIAGAIKQVAEKQEQAA